MSIPAFCLVDTETTGIDAKVDRMIEAAAVIFDAELGVPVRSASWIVEADANPAEHLNRIPSPLLGRWGTSREAVLADIGAFVRSAGSDTICVAHSADFDRQWLPGIGSQWVCSYRDASWPRCPGETGALTAIALAYDVGVVRAHRALEDCLTLAALLTRVHELEHGLAAWLARALEPKVQLAAVVSFQEKDLAKNAGFQWIPDRKLWVRGVRQSQLATFRESLSFKTREVSA